MSDKAGSKFNLNDLFNLKSPLSPNLLKFLAVGLVLGILFINAPVLFGVSTRNRPAGATEVVAPVNLSRDELAELEVAMARELEQTLADIQGVGAVRVHIRLASGPSVVPVFDTKTQETRVGEKAPDGSIRDSNTVTRDSTHVRVQNGTAQSLAVAKRNGAEIAGVVVVAEGARNQKIKEEIFTAVKGLNIPAHLIAVKAGEGGR